MPRPSVWLVRAALLQLVAGAALGSLLLAAKGAPHALPGWVAGLWPLHGEIMLLGWMAQLALGVAYWILPRHPEPPVRGPETPVKLAAVLINAGVLGAGLGPLIHSPELVVAGRLAEAAAVILVVGNVGPRIKEFGRGRLAARSP